MDGETQGPPPLIPPAPQAAKPQDPQPGQQWMVKHPSVGGQWQMCNIIEYEGSLLVQFPDGTVFPASSVQIGGQVAQQTANAVPDNHQDATVSPLNPMYEQFRQDLVKLNAAAMELFKMPLGPLTVMVSRLATERESEGSGHMASYGAGVQIFTPDNITFDKWVEDYLLEIQRREAGKGAE